MFQDQLKTIRKEKGFTQESLAIELHVVRQTVSKWEKGLSVPDAAMLQKLAETLDVSVSRLLGAEEPEAESAPQRNELAEQLAKINEQLAVRNRRARRIWTAVLVIGLAVVLTVIIAFPLLRFSSRHTRTEAGSVSVVCTLDGAEYGYEIAYNDQYQILAGGGDAWIANHVDLPYDDANVFFAHLCDWFEERGGSVRVTGAKGLKLLEADGPASAARSRESTVISHES